MFPFSFFFFCQFKYYQLIKIEEEYCLMKYVSDHKNEAIVIIHRFYQKSKSLTPNDKILTYQIKN